MGITDEQRTVLQIKFENGSKLYLNTGNYMVVGNPRYGTRYPPLDDNFPIRKESQDADKNWMKGSYEAEIEFVPFLEACKDYENQSQATE